MRRVVGLLAALSLLPSAPAWADIKAKGQPKIDIPNQPKEIEAAETIQVPKLTFKISTEASGLKLADFQLKATDVEPPVTYAATRMTPFKDSDEPMSMIILVDGKVRFIGDPTPEATIPGEEPVPIPGAWEQVKQAIDELAKTRTKKTKVALWVYAESVLRKVDLGDPSSISGDMLGAQKEYAKIATAGLKVSLEAAQATLASEEGRRVVVVLGDGRDTDDNVNFRDTLAKFEAASVECYFILGSPKSIDPQVETRLKKLTTPIGGLVLKADPLDTMPQHAANLVANLNNLYTVEFPGAKADDGTKLPFDGQEHDLTIVAKKEEGTIGVSLPKWDFPVFKEPPKKSWLWLYLLLGGIVLIGLIVVAVVLLKKPSDEEFEEEEEAPQVAPPPVAVAPAAPAGPSKTMMIGGGGGDDSFPVVGWIVPLNGAAQFQTFKLSSGKTIIGSQSDCQVNVGDPYMSSQHAEIVMEGGGMFKLLDRGSTNGIKVNEKKVASHELVDNDVFTCGQTTFKFKSIN